MSDQQRPSGGVPALLSEPITDEEIRAAEERRNQLMGRVRLSAAEVDQLSAMNNEVVARQAIADIKAQLATAEGWDRKVLIARRDSYLDMLFKSLRAQGRYREAAFVDPDRAAETIANLEKADDVECDCEDERVDNLVIPRYEIVHRDVESPYHDSKVFVIRCRFCGDTNATPILPHALAVLDAARHNPDYYPDGRGADQDVLHCRNFKTESDPRASG